MNTTRTVVYVAPATAISTARALVSRDTEQMKMAVDTIIITSLAVKLSTELHMTTGASRRKAMSGLKIARAAVVVDDRGNI
ncbi:hypothetical protein F5Y08DRAFT_323444 [Xylaria arbuscula]|nr:hypothetical protein F5Y08DRAFT_323444 [Xylaria arbuscula]